MLKIIWLKTKQFGFSKIWSSSFILYSNLQIVRNYKIIVLNVFAWIQNHSLFRGTSHASLSAPRPDRRRACRRLLQEPACSRTGSRRISTAASLSVNGADERALPRLHQRSCRPARLRRPRCRFEHAMADVSRGEGQGSVGDERLSPLTRFDIDNHSIAVVPGYLYEHRHPPGGVRDRHYRGVGDAWSRPDKTGRTGDVRLGETAT